MTATSFVPSAEEATPNQFVMGAPLSCHVVPEFVEVEIAPGKAAATILVPSAEQATDVGADMPNEISAAAQKTAIP